VVVQSQLRRLIVFVAVDEPTTKPIVSPLSELTRRNDRKVKWWEIANVTCAIYSRCVADVIQHKLWNV